jgi:hypothetical protein
MKRKGERRPRVEVIIKALPRKGERAFNFIKKDLDQKQIKLGRYTRGQVVVDDLRPCGEPDPFVRADVAEG